MNWEKRVRKLQLHYYGDDSGMTVTWEEFLYAFLASQPQGSRNLASHDFELQRIMNTRAPLDIARKRERYERHVKEAQEAQTRALEMSAVADSPIPAETCGTSTCSSPVLTGTTPDESTPATRPHNGEPVGVVRRASLVGGKARAQALSKAQAPEDRPQTAWARAGEEAMTTDEGLHGRLRAETDGKRALRQGRDDVICGPAEARQPRRTLE
jgi:hypothetical protein